MEWKKVSDELPEDEKMVLAYSSVHEYFEISEFYSDSGFNDHLFGTIYADVTHWAPIEQPKD